MKAYLQASYQAKKRPGVFLKVRPQPGPKSNPPENPNPIYNSDKHDRVPIVNQIAILLSQSCEALFLTINDFKTRFGFYVLLIMITFN